MSKEVFKNIKFNIPNAKVNKLEKRIPIESTLIQKNQNNINKQKLEKKIKMLKKKIQKLVI